MAAEPPEPPWYDRETPADVLRRIKRMAFAAALVFAGFCAFFGGFQAFLGLTCSAAVTMISFLWLEEIVNVLLQPAPHPKTRRMIVRALARFLLLGVSLAVTIIIARFNAVSVLLGFSIIVVGICGEALYSLVRSFSR
ncbi:MAG TPA: ATP synthase subunit I [Thermoanaerobaculia bacterium]|jgi:multisubunit Na+/H+ antiporter MnhB subunit|nr:ATP synthase subunit I [Thermoanaerobaculia bacterium]